MRDFKTDYKSFFEKNKKYEVCDAAATMEIFEKIYSDSGIAGMLTSIQKNRPAVEGLTSLLSGYADQYNLNDQWKQATGAWVAFILQPFGYIKTSSKRITDINSIFSSGACYTKVGNPQYKLITTYKVIEVDESNTID